MSVGPVQFGEKIIDQVTKNPAVLICTKKLFKIKVHK